VDYRLYLIGPNGHISRAIELDCRDDEHALQTVREHVLSVKAELWQMTRRVAVIEPDES
jgi:hypothetical protein